MDNSLRSRNEDFVHHAQYYVKQVREQSAVDYDLVGPVRYTVGGKEWICLPMKAKDPEKKPDMMVLITEFDRVIATVQVGGRRERWDDSKRFAADILKLNSPPEQPDTKSAKS